MEADSCNDRPNVNFIDIQPLDIIKNDIQLECVKPAHGREFKLMKSIFSINYLQQPAGM